MRNRLDTFFNVLVTVMLVISVNHIKGDYPFGSSDPLTQGFPEWELQPEPNYYVVQNVPVVITCRATPAIQIIFRCAGHQVPTKNQSNKEIVDARTRRKTLESSIIVSKEEVDEYYGKDGYGCECTAWNNVQGSASPQSVKSTRGVIEAAYLRKRFERFPVAATVQEGHPAELACLPPQGKPLPTVFWLKDNIEINVEVDVNYIITSEGHLIINQARKSDTGNYTCGASNISQRRTSTSAMLTVFVNGGWSSWSEWSECSATCGKGKQRRSRTCSEPAPYNGGLPCEGEQQQSVTCSQHCPDKKQLSTTESLVEVSEQSVKLTTDSTTNEIPNTADPVVSSRDEATKTADKYEDNGISLYIGLGVSVAVALVVVIVVIVICRKHNRRRNAFRDMGPDATQSLTEGEKNKNMESLHKRDSDVQNVLINAIFNV